MYIRYCTFRFNLKSIKTTLADLQVYVLSHPCIMILCQFVVCMCSCVGAIHTWSNKFKLSIYTNVIYMVVWPTHLIENCQRPIWLLSLSLSSAESDTSRHPIKMHYKQLPAIRLNYWNSEAQLYTVCSHSWSHSLSLALANSHIATIFQAFGLKLVTNKPTVIHGKHYNAIKRIVSHLFFSFICLKLQWLEKIDCNFHCMAVTITAKVKMENTYHFNSQFSDLLKIHTGSIQCTVCEMGLYNSTFKWIFYGIYCRCQLFFSSHCKCTY